MSTRRPVRNVTKPASYAPPSDDDSLDTAPDDTAPDDTAPEDDSLDTAPDDNSLDTAPDDDSAADSAKATKAKAATGKGTQSKATKAKPIKAKPTKSKVSKAEWWKTNPISITCDCGWVITQRRKPNLKVHQKGSERCKRTLAVYRLLDQKSYTLKPPNKTDDPVVLPPEPPQKRKNAPWTPASRHLSVKECMRSYEPLRLASFVTKRGCWIPDKKFIRKTARAVRAEGCDRYCTIYLATIWCTKSEPARTVRCRIFPMDAETQDAFFM